MISVNVVYVAFMKNLIYKVKVILEVYGRN